MRVFYECVVIGFNEKEFNDKATGDIVKYNEVFLKGENDDDQVEVQKMTTKINLSNQLDVEGVAELEVDLTGSRKPKLISFRPK